VLLLDTHTWIWSVEDDRRRLGRRARRMLSEAPFEDRIRISPASMFEVTSLYTAGRLRLGLPPVQWIRGALDVPGVRVAELTPAIATDAGSIPRTALPDPLDRLLVATARHLGATFMTSDQRILAYAASTADVRVQDAGT
jgi:PIN domain nuclease of toxin-antitoxin system